jgi:hypothetical protein
MTEHRRPENGLHAPNSALSAGDRVGRPVGQGEEVVSGVLDGRRWEPEYSADRRAMRNSVSVDAPSGAPLRTVAPGFEVEVFYVWAVKASRT